MATASRPEFLEPMPFYIRQWAEPEEFEPERWVAAQGEEEIDPWTQYSQEEEYPVYNDECFCEGCGDQLGCGDNYCRDCVESMDCDYAERAVQQKKSCTSCGSKFKETPVGIRCQCELLTHGRYVAAGK